ncbi:hypothetical protein ACQ259_09770, partial [Stutzerimonas stutzeri]|uniref:hypothetical protein n=1 Tax=Stutzerimonas stutzeri TaxID=316 RepID=UPI003D31BE6F
LWIPGLGVLLPENQGRLPRESAMNLFYCSETSRPTTGAKPAPNLHVAHEDEPMLTEEALRTALEDTIQVLERTRRSFKSRELGQLRRRLIDLLEQLETDTGEKEEG